MVIVGILAGVASLLLNQRGQELNRAASDMQGLVQKARFESIKRNRALVIDVQNSGRRLVAAVDSDSNGSLDTTDTPRWTVNLDNYRAGPGMTFSTSNNFGTQTGFQWRPDGLPAQLGATPNPLSPGKITLTGNGQSRSICISAGGRVRQVSGSTCPT